MRRFILLVVLILCSQTLSAQWTNSYGNSFNNPCSSMMNTFINNNLNQQIMFEKIMKATGKKPQPAAQEPAPAPAPTIDMSKTCFKPGPKHIVPEMLVKGVTGIADADRSQLIQALGSAIDEFEKEVTTKSNVPYGITFLLAVSLKVVKNVDLADADSEVLAQEVQREILANPNWEKMPDDQKQTVYEAALVNASIMIGLFQSNEEASVKLAKEMGTQALKLFGVKE